MSEQEDQVKNLEEAIHLLEQKSDDNSVAQLKENRRLLEELKK